MSYRMSEHDYASSAGKLLLQFVIHLGALGTHDTNKLLSVVEIEPECIFFLGM